MRRIMLIACALLAACEEQVGAAPRDPSADAAPVEELPELPWPRQAFPELPAEASQPNDALRSRIELGRLLFYDPVLSVDRETACASCHSEIWGMGDGLARSIGHGGGLLSGPGRRGGPELRRNSPQLWNLAFRETLFWDGRASSLEEQALAPLRAENELARSPEAAVRELSTLDGYVSLFASAFPGSPGPSVEHLAEALSAFERSLVSSRALYDGYAAGDRYALDEAQIEGMWRFAELGCPDCHAPPLFETEGFFDRGIRGDIRDDGRFEATLAPKDRHAFRVPSLRNVAFSNPYFHDGSVRTLEEAVSHELAQSGRSFTSEDVVLITRFLHDALKDESCQPDRPDELPSGLPVPLDGTVVQRF